MTALLHLLTDPPPLPAVARLAAARLADRLSPTQWVSTAGQGIVEYGLILSLSALVTAAWLLLGGGLLADVLQLIADAVASAEAGG